MRHALLCLVVLAPTAAVYAAPPPRLAVEMTPTIIQEAIRMGGLQKNVTLYGGSSGGGLRGLRIGAGKNNGHDAYASYTTPYLRVMLAAHHAKREYKPFAESDVTPEMIEPVLVVYASPAVRGRTVSSVKAVVVFNKKTGEAIQPTTNEQSTVHYSNAYGAETEGTAFLATFPLDVVNDDNELRIVHSAGETRQKFDTDKIR